MWGYENYLLINCTGKNLELKRNLSISTSAVTKTTASDPKRSGTVGGTWLHRWHSKGKTSKWQQYHSLNRCASWRWNVLLCVFVCTPICVWESWDGQRKKRKRESGPHPPRFNVSYFKGVCNSEAGGFIPSLCLFYPDMLSLCLCRKTLSMKEYERLSQAAFAQTGLLKVTGLKNGIKPCVNRIYTHNTHIKQQLWIIITISNNLQNIYIFKM